MRVRAVTSNRITNFSIRHIAKLIVSRLLLGRRADNTPSGMRSMRTDSVSSRRDRRRIPVTREYLTPGRA